MTDTVKATSNIVSELQKNIIENILWKNNLTDEDPAFQDIMHNMDQLNKLVSDFNRYREDHFAFFNDLLTQAPGAASVMLNDIGIKEMKEMILCVAQEIRDARRVMNDWQRLQTHLNENPAAMSEWKRFMMTLRLTGGDENKPEEEV